MGKSIVKEIVTEMIAVGVLFNDEYYYIMIPKLNSTLKKFYKIEKDTLEVERIMEDQFNQIFMNYDKCHMMTIEEIEEFKRKIDINS